jgi:hypothetical protein
VVGDVAVDKEVAGALLAAAAAALIFDVEGLRGADALGIDTFRGFRQEGRVLIEASIELGRLDAGLATPSYRAAVDVVDVGNLRAGVDDSLFDRVAQVRAQDRRGGVAEDVGAISDGLIHHTCGSLLKGKAVHKRLATVVQRPGGGAVGVGKGVNHRNKAAALVQELIILVADLVIEEDELAEVYAIGVANDGRPAAGQLAAGEGVEVEGVFGFDDDGAEEAMAGLEPVVAVAVEIADALLLLFRDHPFIGDGLAGGGVGVSVGGDGRVAGASYVEAGAMKVEAGGLVGQVVAEGDTEALALVNAESEGLDGVALEADGDGGLGATGAGFSVLSLLLSQPGEVFFEDVGEAFGVVVQVAVEGDIHGDGDYIVAADGGLGIAAGVLGDAFALGIGLKDQAFGGFVAGGAVVVGEAGGVMGVVSMVVRGVVMGAGYGLTGLRKPQGPGNGVCPRPNLGKDH